ncbi:MAG: hypothetical protein HYT38_01525 [Candidatus Sungbacteria bacterium]|uniref:Uncharacterized protein n=1 Tax=Candidatus Sungiibacteriota bacterium TaxID=2750080 RepID=A0A9D6DNA1_9BACT|nr:hypothetical protein [Candidatus Sungbacteria bacterium]
MIKKRLHIGVLVATLALTAGGLSSYTLSRNGYFPAATVNGDWISYREVKENADVSRRIWAQGLAGSGDDLDILFKRGSEGELFRRSLENLIVFNGSTAANLSGVEKNVYNWDPAKFKTRILEPQALMQVLAEEKGADFDAWLQAAELKSKVKIWFVPFEWLEGELKNK